MQNRIYILLLLLCCFWMMPSLILANPAEKSKAVLVSTQKSFVAGSEIILRFNASNECIPALFIQNSYSSTLLNGSSNNRTVGFKLPEWFSKKSGQVNWSLLLNQQKVLSGKFEILPKTVEEPLLETYFGPRQILAGDEDFSMLVVVPTDLLDNPLPDNTIVKVNRQFKGNIEKSELATRNLMAWKNIYSSRNTGEVLVSASCKNTSSKELTAEIYPANPVDFEITSRRNHSYADGNQQLEIITSTIKDKYGNVVSDGTLVDISVVNSQGYLLKTYGETIDGVAVAKMLHPETPDDWNINAFVTGMAESNELSLNFSPITNDFPVSFGEGNRNITVGPIQSFMNQLVPDGIKVSLTIFNNRNKLESKIAYTSKGKASFTLEPEFYKSEKVWLKIEALGVVKEFDNINLHEEAQ